MSTQICQLETYILCLRRHAIVLLLVARLKDDLASNFNGALEFSVKLKLVFRISFSDFYSIQSSPSEPGMDLSLTEASRENR